MRIPLSVFVCVTGVSGSGKSSLVNETLARAIAPDAWAWSPPSPGPHTSLRGVSQIDKLVEIDQSPIGRTPRSNPATYTGVFDEIRKVFAGTREARQLGYKSGRFSFNIKGGRCEECQGQGVRKIEMNFLPDSDRHVPGVRRSPLQPADAGSRIIATARSPTCWTCGSTRRPSFSRIFRRSSGCCQACSEVGAGLPHARPIVDYALGRRSPADQAGHRAGPRRHWQDVVHSRRADHRPALRRHSQLADVLARLVDLGNTVLVIEHNLDVIKSADWIIDLGPEGGAAGGHCSRRHAGRNRGDRRECDRKVSGAAVAGRGDAGTCADRALTDLLGFVGCRLVCPADLGTVLSIRFRWQIARAASTQRAFRFLGG